MEEPMRKKLILAGAVLTLTVAAAFVVWPSAASDKVPKCSMTLCRSVNCSASVLCAKGATVVSCADICNGH
jgi:hypothetical protein